MNGFPRTFQRTIEDIKEENRVLTKANTALKARNATLDTQNRELLAENAALREPEKALELEREKAQLRIENNDLRRERDASTESVERLSAQVTELQAQVAVAEANAETQSAYADKATAKADAAQSMLKVEMDRLAFAEKYLSELTAEKKSLKQELEKKQAAAIEEAHATNAPGVLERGMKSVVDSLYARLETAEALGTARLADIKARDDKIEELTGAYAHQHELSGERLDTIIALEKELKALRDERNAAPEADDG